MNDDYIIWDPVRSSRGDGLTYHGGTPKQAAIAYVTEELADTGEVAGERILHVERASDGLRWVVHLEPVVVVNWRGVASRVAEFKAPANP